MCIARVDGWCCIVCIVGVEPGVHCRCGIQAEVLDGLGITGRGSDEHMPPVLSNVAPAHSTGRDSTSTAQGQVGKMTGKSSRGNRVPKVVLTSAIKLQFSRDTEFVGYKKRVFELPNPICTGRG